MVGFHKSLICKYLFDYLTDCNQNRLSGYHWDLIMCVNLSMFYTLCFILYVLSKWDETNDTHLSGVLFDRFECISAM